MTAPTPDALPVVALSGGKDSTAMAYRLKEIEPRSYTYICTPTGNEPATMFAHWRRLKDELGGTFVPLVANTLIGKIRKYNTLPSWQMRWCTRELKIEPYAAWLESQAQAYDRVVSYVGLRADEPERESGDYSDIPSVEMRFPMREWGWGLEAVTRYLNEKGIIIPARTDCNLCFFQRLSEWYVLWRDDPEAWSEGEQLETLTGHTFRSPQRDTWPASLAGLRQEFESGRIPRGAGQDSLFDMKCRVCRM